MSSTKVTIKEFPLLRSIGANNYFFRSLQLTCDSPKSQEVFLARNPGNYTPLWYIDGPVLLESAFGIDTTRCSNFYFFNVLYFNFFYQGVSRDSFISEANCLFLSISKYDLYMRIGILIGQK